MADWATLARISGSRGNRGEVAAVSESDFPDRFQQLRAVSLLFPDGIRREATLGSAWWHGEKLILKFEGIDSIDAADELAGCQVQVLASERLPLPDGEFYLSDLVGWDLVDEGVRVGPVVSWTESPAGRYLVVRDDETGEELMVPFVKAICRPEVASRRIDASLPPGLRGLNL
jgi:16S rRNA processing protein RimM